MIRLAIHGGAGDLDLGSRDSAPQRTALRAIAAEGLQLLKRGASSLDAVECLVQRLEECPLFNAGIGAVLNRDGLPELDAAIMEGRERRCGAVTGISRSRSPVSLARAIMERSPHVMYMGAAADALNRELGLDAVEPDYFVTELRQQQLRNAQASGLIVLDHDAAFGTVGAVARDQRGHLAAATSTGGLTNKHPGRIGDTPIIGAGTFADDRSAAVSSTGTGECFIRVGFGAEIHARLRYDRTGLLQACVETLREVERLGGRGGCIAVDHEGRLALPFNSRAMYRAWVDADGQVRVAVGTEGGD